MNIHISLFLLVNENGTTIEAFHQMHEPQKITSDVVAYRDSSATLSESIEEPINKDSSGMHPFYFVR